jgi:hypothetical protein
MSPILMIAVAVGGLLGAGSDQWVVYDGSDGPGRGKHIVLISGDEEYRSKEALPQLGKILARHHGFKCTVLFALASAYRHYDFQSESWEQGFGRQVLGETWIAHHGRHGVESTRGVIVETMKDHPIVRGCADIWGPTDVYAVRLPLPDACQTLVLGQVLSGMNRGDEPVVGKTSGDDKRPVRPNDPMMPAAWIKSYSSRGGKTGRVFTTTMGAAEDLASEGLRRLLVNAAYWCVGMEGQIPARAKVDLVGDFHPTHFGFGKLRRGLRPADLAFEP